MNPPIQVGGPSPTAAWAEMCRALLAVDGHAAYHTVARIGTSSVDQTQQDLVDQLLDTRGHQPTDTVANTIFPSALAARCAGIDELVAKYRSLYPRLKAFGKNRGGTYFGRLVDYPDSPDRGNQLGHVVEKLKRETDGSHKSSIYECAVYHPEHDAGKSLNFPCMSSCAFHLDANGGRLFFVAQYRNQHLVERGLGNYLGLARLRDYVAKEAGLEPAELMIVAGHAKLEGAVGPVATLLQNEAFGE